MLEPWNDRYILPPPIITSSCKINFSINSLKSCCNSIIHIMSKQSPLHQESAIFSRFVYKFDKKFRNDIGYRNFKKVNTALRKYLSLNLIKDVQSFTDTLPENDEVEPFLPARQMLEYVLVRVMAFSKIMHRITVCSKQAAVFYLHRIKRGESHWMSLMPYALLCRIWSMVLVLLQHSCNWYNQLYNFLKHLPYKGLMFLKGFELPLDLEEWIDMKNINDSGRFDWSQRLQLNLNSILTEDDEGDLCESIFKYVNNINKDNDKSDDPDIQLLLPEIEVFHETSLHKDDDKGVAISRESFKQFVSLPPVLTNPSVGKVRENHIIENVIDRDSLNEFLENEEEFRNNDNKTSLTNHLSFMQWQSLKTALHKLDNPLINNKKLEKKVKIYWKEKCLDYM